MDFQSKHGFVMACEYTYRYTHTLLETPYLCRPLPQPDSQLCSYTAPQEQPTLPRPCSAFEELLVRPPLRPSHTFPPPQPAPQRLLFQGRWPCCAGWLDRCCKKPWPPEEPHRPQHPGRPGRSLVWKVARWSWSPHSPAQKPCLLGSPSLHQGPPWRSCGTDLFGSWCPHLYLFQTGRGRRSLCSWESCHRRCYNHERRIEALQKHARPQAGAGWRWSEANCPVPCHWPHYTRCKCKGGSHSPLSGQSPTGRKRDKERKMCVSNRLNALLF